LDNQFKNLEFQILEILNKYGKTRLTKIQSSSIPIISKKQNVLLIAPTGSGKTEAAVLPIFISLSQSKIEKGIKVIYITPLKALNRDIFRRTIEYANNLGLSAQIRHGDTSQTARKKMVQDPPDILITTPETFAIMISSPNLINNMKKLEWIVVDELHELLNNERGTHLTVSMERASDISENNVVRVGLSATISNSSLASKFLVGSNRNCNILIDKSIRTYEMDCKYLSGQLSEGIQQLINYVKKIRSEGSILLFTNTRDEAEYISLMLKINSKLSVDIHHGSLSKEVREETEKKLRNGEVDLVVSTSSLELGIDVGNLNSVIQWGSPRQAIKLIQRIGRSRHQIQSNAKGSIFVNRLDDELEALVLINRVNNHNLENQSIHKMSWDVLYHHILGLILQNGAITYEYILNIFKLTYPFQNITKTDIELCINLLNDQGIIYSDENIRKRGFKIFSYYFGNISTIPDIQQFLVMDTISRKLIGKLDQFFIGEFGEPGNTFTLKGNSWRILSIDDDEYKIFVEPLSHQISTIPYWFGELIPIDFYTSQSVGELRSKILSNNNYQVSKDQIQIIKQSYKILGVIPNNNNLVIENNRNIKTIVIHLCFGSKVNETIATILSALLSAKLGFTVETRSDAYRILITSSISIDNISILSVLNTVSNLKAIIEVAIAGKFQLNWKVWHIAKRFGIISSDAPYDRKTSQLIQLRYKHTILYKEVLRELFIEKYDLSKTAEILQLIKNGNILIHSKYVTENSVLSKPILDYNSTFSSNPVTLDNSILLLIKERLEKSVHKFVCLSCGKWERTLKTSDLPSNIQCNVCKSRIISMTYKYDFNLLNIVQKKILKKKLNSDEKIKFKKAWKLSSLIQTFGKLAVTILSGYGIGPEVGGRILKKYVGDIDYLIKDVYFEEKKFVRTRRFWD